jgi:hypothetical protein
MHTNIQQQRDHGCGDAPCCICCRHSPNKPAKEEEATLFQRQLKRSLPFFIFHSFLLLFCSCSLCACQPICSSIGHVRIRSIRPGPAIRVVVE